MWEFDSIARGARKLSTRAQERKERKVELTKTYANANLTLAASRELRSGTTGEEDDARKKWRREKKFSVHAFCMRSSLVHLSHFIYMLFFFLDIAYYMRVASAQLNSLRFSLSLSFSSLSSLLNFLFFFRQTRVQDELERASSMLRMVCGERREGSEKRTTQWVGGLYKSRQNFTLNSFSNLLSTGEVRVKEFHILYFSLSTVSLIQIDKIKSKNLWSSLKLCVCEKYAN